MDTRGLQLPPLQLHAQAQLQLQLRGTGLDRSLDGRAPSWLSKLSGDPRDTGGNFTPAAARTTDTRGRRARPATSAGAEPFLLRAAVYIYK